MIIDTNEIDEDLLRAYGYLIMKNLRPDKDGKWDAFPCIEEHELEYDEIFKKGECIVKLGDVGDGFMISKPKIAKTLKNLPEECGTFNISRLKIDIVDHLPWAESYILEDCGITKFEVDFPNDHPYKLYVDGNNFKNFDHFPEIVDNFSMNCCKNIKSLKESPWIGDQAYIGFCEKLTDISDLQGSYHSLQLDKLPISKLPDLPEEVRSIEVDGCKKLEDVSSILKLGSETTFIVTKCPNIDFYTLCISTVAIETNEEMYDHFYDVYQHFEDPEPSRLEFEKALYEHWFEKDRTIWKKISFKTDKYRTKKESFLKSTQSVEKFKL